MAEETINQNRFTGNVGTITAEEPFAIYPKGVYFRSKDGFGFTIKSFGGDLETLIALKECMNLAYQAGYSDCGSNMMPKVMWSQSEIERLRNAIRTHRNKKGHEFGAPNDDAAREYLGE